jgi:hypothetical protein
MANTAGLPTYAAYRLKGPTANYPTSGLKGALFLASATRGPSDTVYSTTGEVSGTNYVAAGATVNSTTAPAMSSNTAIWGPDAALSWSTVTLSTAFDCLMIHDTGDSNSNKGVFTFGSTTITGGNFTLNMPTKDASTALVRWLFS